MPTPIVSGPVLSLAPSAESVSELGLHKVLISKGVGA